MKIFYPLILLFILAIFLPVAGSSQSSVSFGYDASGNRDSRNIELANNKSATSVDSTDKALQEHFYVDLFSDVKVIISPNPNGGRFKVMVEQTTGSVENPEPIQLLLLSLSGESIRHIERLETINQIDISNHPNGTYVLVISRGNDKRTWKVIKQ